MVECFEFSMPMVLGFSLSVYIYILDEAYTTALTYLNLLEWWEF